MAEMEINHKEHSWGERTTVKIQGGQILEFMVFRTKGKPHAHRAIEIAYCCKGKGWIWIEGIKHMAGPGSKQEIPAGTAHYMEPNPDSEEPFTWVISYKKD